MEGNFINLTSKPQDLFFYRATKRSNDLFDVTPFSNDHIPPWQNAVWTREPGGKIRANYRYDGGREVFTEGYSWASILVWSDQSVSQQVEDFTNINRIIEGLLEFKMTHLATEDKYKASCVGEASGLVYEAYVSKLNDTVHMLKKLK